GGDRQGQASARADGRRPFRRDRVDRWTGALGQHHRDHRAGLLRAHLLGLPAARAGKPGGRLGPAPVRHEDAEARAGRRSVKRLDAWFGGYRSALSQRDLRLLFGGLVTSATGSWAYNVALLGFV